MGTVNITVYGREYPIACDDGQEQHLGQLSQMVNSRVQQLLQQIGRTPEHTMLIYTCLMLADELLDVSRAYKKLDGQRKSDQGTSAADMEDSEARVVEMEAVMARSMQQIAGQLDKLATQLEQAA